MEFKNIIKSSYKTKDNAEQDFIDKGYTYDKSLSTDKSKVFIDKDGKPNIAFRGSKGMNDHLRNTLIAFNLQHLDPDFKNAKNLVDTVAEKYGQKPDVFGHSRGGAVASFVAKDANKVTTYNKPTLLSNMFKSNPKNETALRATFDPVSIFGTLQSKNLGGSINPLKAHSTKIHNL